MIFSPTWVGSEVFQRDMVETLVPLSPIAPTIFRSENRELRVSSRRLDFMAKEQTIGALKECGRLASVVSSKLSSTPLTGVGVNFGFVEDNPTQDLLASFNMTHDAQIGTLGWELGEKQMHRVVTKDKRSLKLIMRLEMGKVMLDLNFHYPVYSAGDAVPILENCIEVDHNSAVEFVEGVFADS